MRLVLETGAAAPSVTAAARPWRGAAWAAALHLGGAVLWLAWPLPPPVQEPATMVELVLARAPAPPPPDPPAAAPQPPTPAPTAPKPTPAARVQAPRPAPAPAKAPALPAPMAADPAPPPATAASSAPALAAAVEPPPPVPAPAAAAEPDLKPAAADAPRPAYPRAARQRGLQGVVMLRVEVTADGAPAEVTVKASSGHGLLDDAAVEAVRRWRFHPARQAGRAVAAAVEVPVRFALEG